MVANSSISETSDSHCPMKTKLLSAFIVLATFIPVLAITEADITPAALVGKTLSFNIAPTSASPFATNGTWTGKFAANGSDFIVGNVSGNTVPIETTYLASSVSGGTDVSLTEFLEGRGSAVLFLYFSDGTPKYEVYINGIAANVNGTFSIGTTAPRVPEISVYLGEEKEIESGVGILDIGAAKVGKSVSRSFTITNTGSAQLKNLVITIDGKHKGDYTATSLNKKQLAIDESLNFKVTFKPRGFGTRKAIVRIKSNDENEDPFKIRLSGSGGSIK